MAEIISRAAPIPTVETAGFWDAAREDRLLIGRCVACGEPHWYPRKICPHCMSSDVVFEPASGDGVVYSYTVLRRAKPPFAAAFVTLAEGPTLLTNLVDCDFETLEIGMPVALKFSPTSAEGAPVPTFSPR